MVTKIGLNPPSELAWACEYRLALFAFVRLLIIPLAVRFGRDSQDGGGYILGRVRDVVGQLVI